MKREINWLAVLLASVMGLLLILVWQSQLDINHLQRSVNHAHKQALVTQSHYKKLAQGPVDELPDHTKETQNFDQFLKHSALAISQASTKVEMGDNKIPVNNTSYLKYGNKESFDAVNLVMTTGVAVTQLKLDDTQMTFNQVGNQTFGLGKVTFSRIGQSDHDKTNKENTNMTFDAYVELDSNDKVQRLVLGTVGDNHEH
ncbi:hypothetical protein JK159_02290 [Weissella minor]|uniref:hypothetical protein n=1 Tax=Weissella minor TaxID=1620 RepID=UPI001BB0141A|nr:hypothetical protein [Weissella minor]MBS0949212.1 hypothetical protein [Weissella minor]